jgi:hypothetical protein
MNDYQTLFEYKPFGSDLIHLIPILIFALIGFGIVFYTKRIFKKYSFLRQFTIFFGFLFGGFATIMLIVTLAKVPRIISDEKDFRKRIEDKSYYVLEGEVENFSPRSEDGHNKEKFSVDGIQFEYSDNGIIKGFHQTSRNNGPITRNGQKVRISYFVIDNINLIQKIEIKK